MKSRETLIRLKRFQLDEKRRKVAQIETMMADFERMATDLDREIAAEEQKAGISDPAHFAYPTYAKAAAQRRDNLRSSADDLKSQLDDAQAQLAEAFDGVVVGRPLPDPFGAYTVAGIITVGVQDLDQILVYMPLEQAALFFNRPANGDYIDVRIDNPDDPDNPDENTAYYLKRLDEFATKFEPFFTDADFRLIFSPEDMFGFSADGIEIQTRVHEADRPDDQPEQEEVPF